MKNNYFFFIFIFNILFIVKILIKYYFKYFKKKNFIYIKTPNQYFNYLLDFFLSTLKFKVNLSVKILFFDFEVLFFGEGESVLLDL